MRAIVGVVASTAMMKTVTVYIERVRRHARLKRLVKTTRKVSAHDEDEIARVGDLVRLTPSRPLSKTKRWVVEAVVRKEREFDLDAVNAAVRERVGVEKRERAAAKRGFAASGADESIGSSRAR